MTKRDWNGGSNIVELLGLLVAAAGLFVTLSDKLQTGGSSAQAPIEQQEPHQAPRRARANYEDRRRLPQPEAPKSYKRQDRLMPSKVDDRLPRR